MNQLYHKKLFAYLKDSLGLETVLDGASQLRLASVVANDTTIPLDARLVALPSKRVQFPGMIIAGSRLLPNCGR